MLMPSIYGKDLFEDLFDRSFGRPFAGFKADQMMRTDVKDTENGYEVTIDMPGVKKEDIKAELKDGNLTISAVSGYSNDEKDENGTYIRRERYSGSCSRSFYVGEAVKDDNIKAKFEKGTLKLMIPKSQPTIEEEKKKYIQIEG